MAAQYTAGGACSPADARTLRGVTETVKAQNRVTPPRMINLAFGAVIANVALSIVNSAMLWGFQSYLREQLIKSNNKAKKPKNYSLTDPQGLHNLNKDLHSGLTVGMVQTLIFGFLLVLLALNFRRGKGWARWATMLVLIIVVQAPFRLLSLGGGGPVLLHLMSALIGITSVVAIVLLVLPESSAYFAKVRGATAGSRPGLRDLFAPRPRGGVDGAPGASPRPAPASARNRASARSQVSTRAAQTKATPPADATATAQRTPATAQRKPTAAGQAKPPTVQGKPTAAAQTPASQEKRPRAKARARVDVTAPAPPSGSAPTSGTAKSRGKSRKGS